jgi:hypothetical protein
MPPSYHLITWCHNPQDHDLNTGCCENLKTQNKFIIKWNLAHDLAYWACAGGCLLHPQFEDAPRHVTRVAINVGMDI